MSFTAYRATIFGHWKEREGKRERHERTKERERTMSCRVDWGVLDGLQGDVVWEREKERGISEAERQRGRERKREKGGRETRRDRENDGETERRSDGEREKEA